MDRSDVLNLKKSYLAGTRVQLQVPSNSEGSENTCEKGTVNLVDDEGNIHVLMDNGEAVIVNPEEAELKRLSIDDQIQEAEAIKEDLQASKQQKRDKTRDELKSIRDERN